ncbi:hypothetical protein JTB14_032155 [Gonioctena quinquepunctata]|nr:hypothetical protein JTB14_032155 [Gonioctena quinquepunctata]
MRHSGQNYLGNESESNKSDCGYHQEDIFVHTIASFESFMDQLEREGYNDGGIFVMKTLTLYWNTLSPYLMNNNPAIINTTKSKLSEIVVLWREIRTNQDLKEIFQYGSSELIWKNVVSMHALVDEFCDSEGSDQYKTISQFLLNYKMYLQANKNIKSGERKEVISKITSITKYFKEKTSCHEEWGSRDNNAKVGKTYENVEQSKLPKDAEKRAQNMVDTNTEDEKTQRAQRGREHDEKKDKMK